MYVCCGYTYTTHILPLQSGIIQVGEFVTLLQFYRSVVCLESSTSEHSVDSIISAYSRHMATLSFAIPCKNIKPTTKKMNYFCKCQKYSVSIEKIASISNVEGKVRALDGKTEGVLMHSPHKCKA